MSKLYTPELAASICEQLAEGGSLRAICAKDGMPSEAAVRGWALDDVQGFAAQYARAREIGYERLAEEILQIADDASGDMIETEHGPRQNAEFVARSRLRVDSRKWMLSKMLPKRFGDKTTLSGDPDAPLMFEKITREIIDPK